MLELQGLFEESKTKFYRFAFKDTENVLISVNALLNSQLIFSIYTQIMEYIHFYCVLDCPSTKYI